mmetsp:Transcript_41835/g.131110  ORF Transcript_41835/g.131110 Transcript_41835/m.131110 type:complete len:321 (-) Transcript_41835:122-1084(-)
MMYKALVLSAAFAVASAAWLREENGRNVTEIQKLLGTVVGEDAVVLPPKVGAAHGLLGKLPENFDSRKNWPDCKDVIGLVRDQSDCGSCWAFGSTEALNDRRCIAYGEKEILSPQMTASCCSGLRCYGSNGCNGGQPSGAWNFFKTKGVVTGGLYGDKNSCYPYAFESCAHHVDSDTLPSCDDVCQGQDECSTPQCESSCTNEGYGKAFDDDRHYAKSAYSLSGEDDIMADIYKYGPVTAALTVYDDFPSYKSGVYERSAGARPLGGHAVEIIGWGVEDGKKYWLVKNSWNPTWGFGGLFKILRGEDHCGIESQISAGEV